MAADIRSLRLHGLLLCSFALPAMAEEAIPSPAAIEAIQAAELPSPTCNEAALQLPPRFSIHAGLQETLTMPGTITRVAIGEPTTADVTVIDQRTLLLQGRKPGETSLMVWTACNKQPIRMLIQVPPIPPVPAELTPAQKLSQSRPAAELAVLPSQIQADIRFVELSRSRLIEIGSRLQGIRGNNLFTSQTATGTISTPTPGNVSAVPFPLDGTAFNILWGGGSKSFLTAINLLEQTGYAYTLSQPSLVAMSGQSAYFLAGGEVPIPVPQGALGGIAIEYKEFGVRLTLTPTILSNQQILLKVAPEVSDLDFANAITIQGSTVPALRIRRTDTTISLADGESFIIGGLVGRSTSSNVNKMPWLADVPILGAFFRSHRFQSDDRELLMIVTPRLVRPLKAGTSLPPMPGENLRRFDPTAKDILFDGVGSPYKGSAPIGFSR